MARPFAKKSDEQVVCRTLMHAWEEADPDEADNQWRADVPGVHIIFICIRCEMIKREIWSPVTGNLLARYYIQPENYPVAPEDRKEYKGLLRSEARIEYVKRHTS